MQGPLIGIRCRSVEPEEGRQPLVGAESCIAEAACDVGAAGGAEWGSSR